MIKILLIDDDPDVRSLMSRVLEKQGYVVETAARKEEAWQKLQNEKPSLILLDVLLSGNDGREFCREIKAQPEMKNVPVIMFSGHPSAGLQFESYGADDFISKPINTEALLDKLRQQVKATRKI